jgi:hypothetical protein
MREHRFFGQRVEVTCEPDAAGFRAPSRFLLGEDAVEVEAVLDSWHDSGFHPRAPRRTWLERRHRTYYRVRAGDGCVYELYVDRTGGRRDWFVARRLGEPPPPDSPTLTSDPKAPGEPRP